MILNRIVWIQRIRTVLILTRLVANLVSVHIFIEPNLICTVNVVLGQKRNVRYDVSVVDHSSDLLHFLIQELHEIRIPNPWWPKSMQLWHSSVENLKLYCGNSRMCSPKTRPHWDYLRARKLFSKILNRVIYFKTYRKIRPIKPGMNEAALASWIENLIKGKILNPVFYVFSSSEYNQDTVEWFVVSDERYNVRYWILNVSSLLNLSQIWT